VISQAGDTDKIETMSQQSNDGPRSSGRSENEQFTFLNRLRRERSRVEVYLVSGTRLAGRIQSFDGRMMLLVTGTGQVALYHTAVSSVQRASARAGRPVRRNRDEGPHTLMPRPRPAPPVGSEGVVVTRRRSRTLIKPDEEQ
jgi:host factor-I protein